MMERYKGSWSKHEVLSPFDDYKKLGEAIKLLLLVLLVT